MTSYTKYGRLGGMVALLLFVVAAIGPWIVFAATVTWTGNTGGACSSGDNTWSTGGPCWSTGSPPANGDDILLQQSGSGLPTNYDLNRTFASLNLTTPSAPTPSGYTVNNAGGTFGLKDGGSIDDSNTRGPDTLNMGVALGGDIIVRVEAGTGGLTFGTNPITGNGGVTFVNFSAADALTLNVANTYTGETIIGPSGEILANVNGAIPTGSDLIVNTGGLLKFEQNSTVASVAGAGTINLAGTLTADGNPNGVPFSGTMAGNGGLTKTGTNNLVLNGANTATGTLTVNSGTVTLTGSWAGNVLVAPGATFTVSGGTVGGTIIRAPSITSSATATGTYGTAFSYNITAANSPINFSLTGTLPAGVTFTAGTGAISGIATQIGTFNVMIGAANAAGSVTQTLGITISKAPLTVTANPQTIAYGQAKPTFSAAIAGFVNGDNSSVVSGAASFSDNSTLTNGKPNAGSWTITPAVGTLAATNYTFSTFNTGAFTVSQVALTVTANPLTVAYGAALPFTASISGFLNGDTSAVVSGTAAFSNNATLTNGKPNAGSWTITPAVGTLVAANYTFSTFNTAALTVSKASLTVTGNPLTIAAGAPLPAFTATITGFVNGDNSSAVSGSPAFSLAGAQPACSGTVPITVTAGSLSAANYSFTFVNGTLTVNSPGASQALNVLSGNNQTGFAGTALGAPLVVQVVAAGCGAVSPGGVQVSFSVVTGSASIGSAVVTTGPDGTAQTTITPMSTGSIVIQASSNAGTVQFSERSLPASLAPGLQALPSTLSFNALAGGANPAPANIDVINSGAGFLNWTASAGSASWLSVTPSGTTPSGAAVSVNVSGLAPDTYSGTITLTAGSSKASVPVTLTVAPAGSPMFTFSPSSVTLTAPVGSSTVTQLVGIGSAGGAITNWAANINTGTGGWLGLSSTSGTVPFKIGVEANPAGLTAGQYTGNVEFTGSGGLTGAINVIFNVTSLPQLTTTTPILQFAASTGGAASTQSLAVGTSSGASLAIVATVSGSTWLKATAPANAPGTISVTVSPGSLAPGQYSGYVQVASSGASNTLVVPVTLTVGNPLGPGTLSTSPSGVILTSMGAATSQVVSVSSNGSASFSWAATVTAGGNWLLLLPATGGGNGSFTVSANAASLAAGSYQGQVAVTSSGTSNSSLIVPVTLVVPGGSSPVLQVISPATQFNGAIGTPVSLQTALVSGAGTPMTGAAITASFSDGEPSIALMDAGGGNYLASWTPQVAGPIAITVAGPSGTSTILSGSIGAGSLPVIFRGGAVDAAFTLPGTPLEAGGIASLYGANFATQTLSAAALPLPFSLAGLSMTINAFPAALYYVSPGQVNFEVPWELQEQTEATIQITTPSGVFVVGNVPLAPYSPGVFTVDSVNDPAATALSGQLITSSTPVQAGQTIVLYVSGLGAVSNTPQDGVASPSSPLSSGLVNPLVTIGGINAQVIFAGLTPTLAGLYQIDVVVPSQLPAGPATVVVTAGGLLSPPVQIQLK